MKIDRLVALTMLLLERRSMGAAELARLFEVSTRTIYRDVDALGKAGIPIVSSPGPGGGIGIMDSYKLEKRVFSVGDITFLLAALGNLHSSVPGGEMTGTLAKLRGMIPQEQLEELERRASQIKIDVTPWIGSGTLATALATIRTALERQEVLGFCYGRGGSQGAEQEQDQKQGHEGVPTQEQPGLPSERRKEDRQKEDRRELEPGRLLYRGQFWYVQGWCRLRQDFRTFRLSRMTKLALTGEHFTAREFPTERMDRFFLAQEERLTVLLRVHASIWDEMVQHFGEANVKIDGPEHYVVKAHMPLKDTACRFILGYGDLCQCLEPASMRALLHQTIARMAAFYG